MSFRSVLQRALGIGLLLQILPLSGLLDAQSDASGPAADASSESQPAADAASDGQSPASDTGVAYSKLFKETGGIVPGANSYYGPVSGFTETMQSENLSGSLYLGTWKYGPRYDLSLQHGFPPDEAHLKLGPVYFRLDEARSLLIYRNIETNTFHRDDWYSINDLRFTIMAQLSEGISLAATGNLFYLPFQNEVGLITDLPIPGALASFGLFLAPGIHGQIAYTTLVGDWPVTLADDFRVRHGDYSDSFDYNPPGITYLHYNSERGDESYTYGSTNSRVREGGRNYLDEDFSVLSNVVSLSTQRTLEGDWDFTSRLYREDLWYLPSQNDLPSAREGFAAVIISKRENLRFKPFASYHATHIDGRDGIYQTFEVGATGPITDQLFLYTSAGYVWNTVEGSNSTLIGTLRLDHLAGPSTSESLFLRRAMSDFNDQIIDSAGYHLTQVLGPQVSTIFFADYSRFTANYRNISSSDRKRVGNSLVYAPSPKSKFTASSYYLWIDHPDRSNQAFTEELRFEHIVSQSVSFDAIYRFRDNTSSPSDGSFVEHLGLFSIQKTF